MTYDPIRFRTCGSESEWGWRWIPPALIALWVDLRAGWRWIRFTLGRVYFLKDSQGKILGWIPSKLSEHFMTPEMRSTNSSNCSTVTYILRFCNQSFSANFLPLELVSSFGEATVAASWQEVDHLRNARNKTLRKMGKSIVRIIKKMGKRDRESRFSQRTRSRNQKISEQKTCPACPELPLVCSWTVASHLHRLDLSNQCRSLPISTSCLHQAIAPLPGQESCLDIVFVIDWYVSTSRILSWHFAGYCTDDWCISLFLCSLHASSRSFVGFCMPIICPNFEMQKMSLVYY